MSTINGKPAEDWISENSPEIGVFRAYWTEDGFGISLEDTGYGLRYEWYYKDGKRVDGVSKGWYPNGQIKTINTYKDGKLDGLWTGWYSDGQKKWEYTYKDGKEDGVYTIWYENGQKESERTYKEGKLDGLRTGWYENGEKILEKTYKDGYLIK